MYAQIVLLRKLPKSIDFFDYQVPKKLDKKIKVGHLVSVPFRKKEVSGLVFNIGDKSKYTNLKTITRIDKKEPLLTKTQLELAKFVSEYYYVSISTVIRQIMPPLLKKPRTEKIHNIPYKGLKIGQSNEFNSIISQQNNKILYKYNFRIECLSLYIQLLKKYNKSQTLILFPEIIDIENFYQYLPLSLRKKTAIIHHRQSRSNRFHTYLAIKSGRLKIILGTPLSVFSAFKNLGLIIIDQEESQGHKQYDQNPRFNAKNVAQKLAELWRSKIIFSSPAPSISTLLTSQKNNYKFIKSSLKPRRLIEIIDMRKEGGKPLSITLSKEIENNLAEDKKSYLFVSRKGFSRSLQCEDCGYTFECPKCKIPFAVHQKNKGFYLFCHRCSIQREMPLTCIRCHGSNIKNIGVGLEKIADLVAKQFPGSKIAVYPNESNEKIKIDKFNIIISTGQFFKKICWEKISLFCVTNADAILNLPDFRSQERNFQMLSRISSYFSENHRHKIFIQTHSPENNSLKYFPSKYDSFSRQELKIRKEFGYPPFTKLIKISSQNPKQFLALEQARKVYQLIVKKNESKKIIISPVSPAFVFKRFNRYFYQIVLKIMADVTSNEVKNLINLVPDSFLVDVDPENLL